MEKITSEEIHNKTGIIADIFFGVTDRHSDNMEGGGGDYDEFLKRVGINLCGSYKEKCEMRNRFLI